MLTAAQAAGGVLYSESVLSLYPQLVKRITAPLTSQVAVRCITYSLMALGFGGIGALAKVLTGGWLNMAVFFALGAINLLHVWTSYYAFQKLPSGVSLTMFYTYPIMNVIGAWLFFGESIGLKAIPFFALALVGVWMVATAKGTFKSAAGEGVVEEGMKDKDGFAIKDLLAGLGRLQQRQLSI